MRKTYIILTVIVFTSFFVRMFPFRKGVRDWDETVYLQDAERVAGQEGSNYSELDFRPPMLALLGGAVFALGGDILTFQILIVLLSTSTVLLTFFLGKRMFSERTGLLASAVMGVALVHSQLSHEIMVDPVLPFFWLLTSFFLYSYVFSEGEEWNIWLAGFFTGLAVLTKFTSLVLVGASILVLWMYGEGCFWKRLWRYSASFLVVLSPYFIWNFLEFGTPLNTFLEGFRLSGATDSFFTYFQGFYKLVPIPLLLSSIFVFQEDDQNISKTAFLLVFVYALFLPLQVIVSNKELRFLLPITPFVILVGARQISRIFKSKKLFVFAASILFLLSSVNLAVSDDVKTLRRSVFVTKGYSDVYDASIWLRENTDPDATVYSFEEWPVISYYSRRNITLLPTYRSFEDDFEMFMNRSGYLVHQEYSERDKFDTDFLDSDPRFFLNKTFSNRVYIYLYREGYE